MLIEKFSEYSNGYPSVFIFNNCNIKYFKSKTKKGNIGRFVLALLIFPISILWFLISKVFQIKIFNQAKSLPSPLRDEVFKKCVKVLKEKIGVDVKHLTVDKGLDGDYLRLLYHYVYENSERHASKLQNYVALYGFTRNVSFIFIILFWVQIFSLNIDKIQVSLIPIVLFCILAYLFYLGFIKFYRRYSLEAIMATSIIDLNDTKNS